MGLLIGGLLSQPTQTLHIQPILFQKWLLLASDSSVQNDYNQKEMYNHHVISSPDTTGFTSTEVMYVFIGSGHCDFNHFNAELFLNILLVFELCWNC